MICRNFLLLLIKEKVYSTSWGTLSKNTDSRLYIPQPHLRKNQKKKTRRGRRERRRKSVGKFADLSQQRSSILMSLRSPRRELLTTAVSSTRILAYSLSIALLCLWNLRSNHQCQLPSSTVFAWAFLLFISAPLPPGLDQKWQSSHSAKIVTAILDEYLGKHSLIFGRQGTTGAPHLNVSSTCTSVYGWYWCLDTTSNEGTIALELHAKSFWAQFLHKTSPKSCATSIRMQKQPPNSFLGSQNKQKILTAQQASFKGTW